MTCDEMLSELNRLNAICPKAWDDADAAQRKALLGELARKFLHLPLERWQHVVTHVIDTHTSRTMPVVAEFTEGLEVLNRKAGGAPTSARLSCCGGLGLVARKVKHVRSGDVIDSMIACPSCFPTTRLKHGWELA